MKARIAKAANVDLSRHGGNWMAICDLHETYVNAQTKSQIAGIKQTEEFCDCCTADCTPFCKNCDQWEEVNA